MLAFARIEFLSDLTLEGKIKIIPLPDIIKNCRDIFIDKLEDRFKDSKKKKKKLLQREKKKCERNINRCW